ncbi:P-loop containing nucleoside triphosphate hydrolase protein [Apiosordaria backusii]|uniref:P-loop containing nucleoside triphosphate hydrolase protein n=1 Tax=Apiosordaria backusii TaxID=314023 RepID=A0AA40DPK0_9PEZI|nr:P-loop containing nucleoside triphosphate hydrolase protein [Apiosordaria backusii]
MDVEAIDISDDELTDSSVEANPPPASNSLGKRKAPVKLELEERIIWTDDSDDGTTLNPPRATKRRATATTRSRGRGKGRGRGSRPSMGTERKTAIKTEESGTQQEYAEAQVPEYLQQRRRRFDKDREQLNAGGLKIPPDYSELYFSDDERQFQLAEKPRFDERSGIKPCRPYQPVELEYSAGVIPASIAQYLREYQIDGVKFLHQRFVYQKGCILGDDMGLGKTVQVAAFLTVAFGKTGDERDAKRMRKMRRAGDCWYPRVLIVCPGSVIQNWKNELNRWGWWHVDLYHGIGKEDVLDAAKAGRLEIMITTFATYKNNCDAVNAIGWDCVVADECHNLKDKRSETTRAMDRVNAMCRIGLTGTAIQNKYEELWTLLNWTNPGRFGTLAEWTNTITRPLTIGQSHEATLKQLSIARTTAKKLVQNLLPDYFLRRMKTLIAHQLPKKTDMVVFCPLTDIQSEAYQNFIDGDQIQYIKCASEPCPCASGRKQGWCCYKTLEDGRSWKSLVFPCIMTLQKLANHLTLLIPSSADPNDKQDSELSALRTCIPDGWEKLWRNRDSMLSLANPEFCGKWKILRKLLQFWHDNGDKALVFSHSVKLLRILQHLFHNTSYNVSFLDGSLSYEDRQKVVDEFNTDPAQFVFLISTKAGGVGLNITSANKVVIFDPHWNPAHDLQAQDRAYRIGQVRDVDVFRLISAGTIEEIVYARQIYKQQQANIGYNASNERRYFKGVQKDSSRKGEIFGLNNLFSFHADQVVLREIVNKTNIAEAKAGVHLSDIDLEKMAQDEDDEINLVKQEDDNDDTGMSLLAKLITAENKEDILKSRKAQKPQSGAIAAILASAGVEYTHENSEVIGTSRVEAQLSRRAELAANKDSQDFEGNSALFADSQANSVPETNSAWRVHYKFNPPAAVMRRQFCSMAKEFGFANATDFALVVESWTQEQRRNCLDTFYRSREAKLLEKELAELKEDEARKQSSPSVSMEVDAVIEDAAQLKRVSTEGEIDNSVVNKDVGDTLPPPPRPVQIKMEQPETRRTSTIFLSDDDDEDDEL